MRHFFDVCVTINGTRYERTVEPRLLLSDFLRHDLGLTGTHVSCEHGVCGSCTILFDGQPVRSCLMFAVQANGHEILTVEGLGTPENLHPLQEAFWEAHSVQCGFCTPGFLMSATDLLRTNPNPTMQEAKQAVSGHICPCGNMVRIIRGVMEAGGA